jgi:DNA-binding XRE family transcriptional regulator
LIQTKGQKVANDDLQYIVRMLQCANLTAVAKKVDLSYGTIYNIAKGKNISPSFATVQKLADFFRNTGQ